MSEPGRDLELRPRSAGAAQTELREYILLLPRLGKLIWRLTRDPRVPARAKATLALLALYVFSPVDLIPDFIPGLGQLDDIVIAAFALDQILNRVPEHIVHEHWDGDDDVLTGWAAGGMGVAAWSQSWSVIQRGHFRITATAMLLLALGGSLALRSATSSTATAASAIVFEVGALGYALTQYLRNEVAGTITGAAIAALGALTLGAAASAVEGWPHYLAVIQAIAGGVLLGGVTNGMLLGHWYLNQPGLKPWALGRLTDLSVIATAVAAAAGLAAVRLLTTASTSGAGLGLPGVDTSFGPAFFGVWLLLILFTGAVVLAARRCIQIRSIQSATGLYYVALLTAGVAEFLVTYLMVNAK